MQAKQEIAKWKSKKISKNRRNVPADAMQPAANLKDSQQHQSDAPKSLPALQLIDNSLPHQDNSAPSPYPQRLEPSNLPGVSQTALPEVSVKKAGNDNLPRRADGDIPEMRINMPPPPEHCRDTVKELGEALLSGDADRIQKMLKNVKTPEDMKNLQDAIEYVNQTSGNVKLSLANRVKDGFPPEPILTIHSSYHSKNVGCGGSESSHSIEITADKKSAVYNSSMGFVPTIDKEVDVKDALGSVSKTLKSQSFESYIPKARPITPADGTNNGRDVPPLQVQPRPPIICR